MKLYFLNFYGMIKFFLHWWVTSPRTEKNKKFFQEIVKSGWNKILIFPFAHKKREYEGQFESDSKKFIEHNSNLDIECAMASEDIEILIEQIKEYKSLYFCGWLQDQHLEILRQIDNLQEFLKDKTVSWNSAGTMIWVKHFYSSDHDILEDGLWFVPIKVMVHWESDDYPLYNKKNLEKLEKYWEDLPVYKIREQEYQVFEI